MDCLREVSRLLIVQCLEGHGDAINDISVHPLKHSLVLTASRVSFLLKAL